MGADAEVAGHLKIDEGFPLLKITSMVYENETPLEYRESYYRGDKYKFFATRTLSN
jgi:GntR family transcriptional regulator